MGPQPGRLESHSSRAVRRARPGPECASLSSRHDRPRPTSRLDRTPSSPAPVIPRPGRAHLNRSRPAAPIVSPPCPCDRPVPTVSLPPGRMARPDRVMSRPRMCSLPNGACRPVPNVSARSCGLCAPLPTQTDGQGGRRDALAECVACGAGWVCGHGRRARLRRESHLKLRQRLIGVDWWRVR